VQLKTSRSPNPKLLVARGTLCVIKIKKEMKNNYLNLSAKTQEYIEFALADGKLTSNEIDLIKRKATEFGDDPVEVEMVLSYILSAIDREKPKEHTEYIEIKPTYGLIDSFFQTLRKYSKFKGRASRSEFWYFVIANFIILFTLFIIIGSQGENFGKSENNLIYLGLFSVLYPLLMIMPFLSLCTRRLHDINSPGWFALIPLYNIYLFCKKGYIGDNKYGDDPHKIVIKKTSNQKHNFIEKITNDRIETIGATMFGIGATLHEAIELKIIDYNQLDHINKWLWIIGGILIIIPKSIKYLSKRMQKENT
jgi:uncharacterized membrane protein YhaH (DUF805 family)